MKILKKIIELDKKDLFYRKLDIICALHDKVITNSQKDILFYIYDNEIEDLTKTEKNNISLQYNIKIGSVYTFLSKMKKQGFFTKKENGNLVLNRFLMDKYEEVAFAVILKTENKEENETNE